MNQTIKFENSKFYNYTRDKTLNDSTLHTRINLSNRLSKKISPNELSLDIARNTIETNTSTRISNISNKSVTRYKKENNSALRSLYEVCASEVDVYTQMSSDLEKEINYKKFRSNMKLINIKKDEKENDDYFVVNKKNIVNEIRDNKLQISPLFKNTVKLSSALNSTTAFKFKDFFSKKFKVNEKTEIEKRLLIDKKVPTINLNNNTYVTDKEKFYRENLKDYNLSLPKIKKSKKKAYF